jgi:hypothetical protein
MSQRAIWEGCLSPFERGTLLPGLYTLYDRRTCITRAQVPLILPSAMVSPTSVLATRLARLGLGHFERPPVHLLTVQCTDCRIGALFSHHLDKGKPSRPPGGAICEYPLSLAFLQCPDGRQVDPVSDSRSIEYHCVLGNYDNAVTDGIVFSIPVLLAFVGADSDPVLPSKALSNLCRNLATRHLVNGFNAAVPALRAACFNRRTCVRCPLGNRLGLALLVLSAMGTNSLGYKQQTRKGSSRL